MPETFICQEENLTCSRCSSEIPKGAWFGQDHYGDPVCQDCIINLETTEYEPI